MRNSAFILRTLDDLLDRRLDVTLHLLGGAALDLVYGIERFSEDVDCICTMTEACAIDSAPFEAPCESQRRDGTARTILDAHFR